jgi:DNA-binding FadR family transcriptional regulator
MVKLTLHDDLLDTLGARIVATAYERGRILRTDVLETEFGVSRTVVREALKVLESMRMIEVRRAVGITVLGTEHWNVFDPRVIRWRLSGTGRADQLRSLTDIRIAVEPIAAGIAARQATRQQGADLLRLAGLLETSGADGDLDSFLAHDIAYHRLLLKASANDMFASLGDVVAAVLTGRTVHHLMPRHPKIEARRLHMLVAQSVRARNRDVAEAAMRELLVEVEQHLTTSRGTDSAP